MKAFIVVSLVCYFGAASASLLPKLDDLVKKAAECRRQAYLEVGNCTKYALANGTAELQCISKTVADYIDCMESSPPTPLLGAAPLAESTFIAKIKCLFNSLVDTVKCIINSHLKAVFPSVLWPVVAKCLVINFPVVFECFQ